jgi:dTDP-4-amino-4,6-dideoxygalactose transaminase
VQGPLVAEFERKFERFTGATHAVATSSCTTALHVAVAALELSPGDEVIVPAFTWISTPNAVEYMGATPVFCDISIDTFNIEVSQIESLVTARTVGIIPVHLFGLCADMTPVLDIARRHGLWVVEDAACAFGATHGGVHAGLLGDAGCFSFHPRKSITTGEGGMVTTARGDLRERAVMLRDLGAARSTPAHAGVAAARALPEFPLLGYNYRMTDIQGALGCAQLDRAEWLLAERAERARRYDQQLQRLAWLRPPQGVPGCSHGFQSYVCLFQPEPPTLGNAARLSARRDAVMLHLEHAGISTRPGTHAPALSRYYSEKYRLKPEQYPNAYLAEALSLALPLYVELTEGEQAEVCDALADAMAASHQEARVGR